MHIGGHAPTRVVGLACLACLLAAIAAGLAASPVPADEHTFDEAQDFTEEANFTINLPERTDHYPGDHPVHAEHNGYNASIEYFSAGAEAMRELDAEEGSYLDMIVIRADFIDYSQCDATSNTKTFGIDRGNNDSGTRTDEGLIQYRKNSQLKPGGLTVTFYDFDDLSGDPPYMAPEDAIVAAQGAGSNDGPCLKMTSDPGWYRMTGFINGTTADNGKGQQPSDDAREAGIIAKSNYVYICECDSRQEARDTLGPPPTEDGSPPDDGATPTPTVVPTDPAASPTATSTPTPVPATETATAVRRTATAAGTTTATRGDRSTDRADGDPAGQAANVDRSTPTIGAGQGFGPVAMLVAVVAAALLLGRGR